MLDPYVQAEADLRPARLARVLNQRSTPSTPLLEGGPDRDRLEEARARFTELSEDMLSIWGLDGRIKWVNPAYERVTGFSSEELIGRPYVDFLHPDDQDLAIAQAAKLADRSGPQSCELRVLCRDGAYRRMLVTATPSLEDELIYAVARDLSAEHALDADSATLMGLSLDLLCICDFDGRLRRVNPTFERVTGCTADELLALSYVELVHPDDFERVNAELQRLPQPGSESRGFTARTRHSDGSYRTIQWHAASSAERGMIFAIGREETERLRSEESLREAEERFEAAFDQAPIGMALSASRRSAAGVLPAGQPRALRDHRALRGGPGRARTSRRSPTRTTYDPDLALRALDARRRHRAVRGREAAAPRRRPHDLGAGHDLAGQGRQRRPALPDLAGPGRHRAQASRARAARRAASAFRTSSTTPRRSST